MLPVAPRARRFVAASVVRIGLALDCRDLVLRAELEERRDLHRAVRRVRGAGLLSVYHDVDFAEAELLFVADPHPLPLGGNVVLPFFERRARRKSGKCSSQHKMYFHVSLLNHAI